MQKIDLIELAEWLHNTQEKINLEAGIKANKIISFNDLPHENRMILIKLANRILNRFSLDYKEFI